MALDKQSAVRCEFIDQISAVPSDEWNSICDTNTPFLRHEFLSALEQSESVSTETGWTPSHFVMRQADGSLLAVAPMYIKTHSYGEYVFDWAWADAYQRYGLKYYPKLLCAVPFTPCQGPRLLVNEERMALLVEDEVDALDFVGQVFLDHCTNLCRAQQLSSFHLLFPSSQVKIDGASVMERLGIQYHWRNKDYRSFDHYLETFTSRKRKNINKERKRVAQMQLEFCWLSGEEITANDLKHFYSLYVSTYFKRGQSAYLNLKFFELLLTSMSENLVFIMVYDQQKIVAGALFFKGKETLYGRYWGCLKEYDLLHFETCYYKGIEYCIEHGIKLFDAGAQGEHKLLRGFEPVYTRSYHYLQEPAFADAVGRFLEEERSYLAQAMEQAKDALPFKKDAS